MSCFPDADRALPSLFVCFERGTDHLPLLFYELPKSRHDEFAVLFGGFVGDGAERIEEYSSSSFVGLGGFGKCALKLCLGHL